MLCYYMTIDITIDIIDSIVFIDITDITIDMLDIIDTVDLIDTNDTIDTIDTTSISQRKRLLLTLPITNSEIFNSITCQSVLSLL